MQKLLLLLILSFFSSISLAGYLDDWTNDQLCGWMDNPSPPEHIVTEVKNRGLSCGGDFLAASDSTYVLNAPKAEFYQRQYDMTSEVDQILSNRKTINPFNAWNYRKALNQKTHYGISWTNGWDKGERLFSNSMFELESPDWNYYYPNGPWSYWNDHAKQKSLATNIDWAHDAEYGVTKALNVIHPSFPQAFAKETASISNKGFHGALLDWWHINHPVPWRGARLESAMMDISNKIRKQAGEEFLLIGNTNWRRNSRLVGSLNGVFSELYKTPYSRSDSFTFEEIAEMEELIKFNEKHLRYPKLIAFEPWRITDQSDPANRTSEENIRFSRLYSAMATVIPEHGYILYADNNPDFEDGDHDHFYYDVYSVDLGKPVSKYTPIAKGVAYKKFEDGYIAFNRLKYDVTVNFGDFESVIPSMDAVFLNEDGTPYVKKEEVEEIKIHKGVYNVEQITKTFETATTYDVSAAIDDMFTTLVKVPVSNDDPTVSKVIEVIQGDKFIVNIAEPHELAGTDIALFLRDTDAPNATKSCPKQMEYGLKVKDFVSQKLKDASSIKLTNFRKTNAGFSAHIIVDGADLGTELIENGYASDQYVYWNAYFCNPMKARGIGNSYWGYGTGTEVDADKAIFWYERAISINPDKRDKYNAQTTYRLSQAYQEKGDTNKSLDYLKQSASIGGWMEAEETLGRAYLYGRYNEIVISKNTSEAKKLLKKAHEHGSKTAEGIYCNSLPKAKRKTCKF